MTTTTEPPQSTPQSPNRAFCIGLAALTLALIFYAGARNLAAPWVMGDERIYISLNPLVIPQAEDAPSLLDRIGMAFATTTDLYQPLPIATYIVEHGLFPDTAEQVIRRNDVILHAINALLIWAVIYQLLVRFTHGSRSACLLVAWSASLLWALHPALVLTFAADMGRTHLLSALFLLLALLLQLIDFKQPKPSVPLGVGIVMCALLANLSKPAPGLALMLITIIALGIGWRDMARLPRIYAVLAISVGFALLNLQATESAGFITDAENALFGDPLSRAGYGLWLYARNMIAPWLVTFWHPPSPNTSLANPLVWLGFLIIALPVLALVVLLRKKNNSEIKSDSPDSPNRNSNAPIIVGIVIFIAALLPLLAIASSRNVAVQDRYLYVPLIGVVAILAALALRLLQLVAMRVIPIAVGVLCVGLAVHDRTLAATARDTAERAAHALSHYPDDPRVAEFFAVAQSGAGRDAETVHRSLQQAIAMADAQPEYFVSDIDRAAFYRRQSFQFAMLGDVQSSLQYAEKAAELDPNSPKTNFRLATARRQVGDIAGALAAFITLEQNLGDNEAQNAIWLTNFGRLLLRDLDRPQEAKSRFQRVVNNPKSPPEARRLAAIDLAVCEVRGGDGAKGREMLLAFLQQHPEDAAAWQALGESHLRSNLWQDAKVAYAQALVGTPTDYRALRGFHSACINSAEPGMAFQAWDQAFALQPQNGSFAAFRLWSALCAEIPGVCDELPELPADEPVPVLVRLTYAICLAESGNLEAALAEAERAESGLILPDEPVAASFRRAEQLLLRRHAEEPAAAANVLRARLLIRLGMISEAEKVIDGLAEPLQSEFGKRLRAELAEVSAGPRE